MVFSGLKSRKGKENLSTPTSNPSLSNQQDENGAVYDAEKTGEEDNSPYPRLTFRTFVMTVLAAMGGFVFGYDTGQISGFLEMDVFIERFGEKGPVADHPDTNGYHFTNVRSGLIVALLSIGTLVGCLIASPLSNTFGRKSCIPWWCVVFIIGVTIQLAVAEGQWVGIVMGRWVAGLGVGSLSVLVPLYISESAPKQVRGACVSSYQLFITIGIFVADCINFGTEKMTNTGSYRIPMAIGYIWALILGGGIMFLPESPRWDISKGFHDRARVTMTKFYGVSLKHGVVRRETEEINHALEAAQGDHPWYEAITGPRMLYRVLLAMGLQMGQQLTGANYFFYYGTTVFAGVGISNSFVTAIILGGVNFGSTFLGLYMVERFGRRKCLFYGAMWQFCCFIVFASIGHFKFNQEPTGSSESKTAGYVMIVFACLFIVSFASTWGPMVWAAIGEMFPYRYRAVSMALAVSSNWFWNFMLAFFTPFITGAIDYRYGYVFAGCNFAAALLVFFFLIESAGRTIEEVDAAYLLYVNPRKSAHWNPEEAGGVIGVNTDSMFLDRGGRNIQKRGEAGREGEAQQVEHAGVLGGDVTDMSGSGQPIESSGGIR